MYENTKVIVLVGFSTAGKSSILDEIKKRNGEKYEYVDTDSCISKDFCGHIYNVFLKYWNQNDPIGRKEALSFISAKEEEILNSLICTPKKPTLIAAGPFLDTRLNWIKFIDSMRPKIFHISVSAEAVYEGLLKRHKDQEEIIGNKNGFGCWDLNVTKKYENGKYILLEKNRAINNIEGLLKDAEGRYVKLRNENCFESEILKNNSVYRNNFIEIVEQELSV